MYSLATIFLQIDTAFTHSSEAKFFVHWPAWSVDRSVEIDEDSVFIGVFEDPFYEGRGGAFSLVVAASADIHEDCLLLGQQSSRRAFSSRVKMKQEIERYG